MVFRFSGVIVMDWNKSQQTMPRSAGHAGFAGQASLLISALGAQHCQCANSLRSNTQHSILELIIRLSDEDVAQVCWKTVKRWRASTSYFFYMHTGQDLQQEGLTQGHVKISMDVYKTWQHGNGKKNVGRYKPICKISVPVKCFCVRSRF